MKPPTETEHWPRLSTQLKGERHPFVCQSCGDSPMIVTPEVEPEDVGLLRWQEHDQQDRPQPIIVVLCKPCSDRLIEPHERLYRPLTKWTPALGAMRFCVDCMWRDGLHCAHRDTKENGGAGLILKMPQPTRGFIDGTNYSGPMIGRYGEKDGPSEVVGWTPENYHLALEALEAIIANFPVDALRADVMTGEAHIGKHDMKLPSGRPFDANTRRARVFLDFFDELQRVESGEQ